VGGCVVLGTEPRALYMLDMDPTTELWLQPVSILFRYKKVKLREVKQFIQSHTVPKWLSKTLDIDLVSCNVYALTVPGLGQTSC
jgi:hypothetical protein